MSSKAQDPRSRSASPFRGKLAKHLLLLLVFSVLLPVTFLAVISFGSVSRYLQKEATDSLRQEAKSLAMSLLDRLDLLSAELAQAEDAGLFERTEIPRLPSFSQAGLGSCASSSPEPRDPPSALVPRPTPSHCERLRKDRPVLMIEPGALRPIIVLVRPTSGDRWVWGRVRDEAFWGRASTAPPNVGVGVLSTDGRHLLGGEDSPEAIYQEILAKRISLSSGSLVWREGGAEYLAAFWAIPMAGNYGAEDWIVALHVPLKAAFASVRSFRLYFPMFVGLVLMSSLLIGSVLLRRTLVPVQELVQATAALGQGDFGVVLTPPRDDEIGELTTAFHNMRRKLQRQFTALSATASMGEEVVQGGDRATEIFFTAAENMTSWEVARLGVGIENEVAYWHSGQGFLDSASFEALDLPPQVADLSLPTDKGSAHLTLWGTQKVPADGVELLEGLLGQAVGTSHRVRLGRLLEEERSQLAMLVEKLPYGILVLDRDGRIRFSNRLGTIYLSSLHDRGPTEAIQEIGGHSIEDLCEDGGWHELSTSPDRDGAQIFTVVARSLEPDTERHKSLIALRDITSEKLVERQLHQQERLAAVGQLAAGMAHDLNNMLHGIRVCGELIEEGSRGEYREDLQTLLELQDRAATLIQQVLDFSRRSESQQQSIDLIIELEKLVSLLRRTLPATIDLRLAYEPGVEELPVRADPVQLQQVVANLVVNARDSMPTGGSITIEVGSKTPAGEEQGQWISMFVVDTGSGIPPEIQSKVFDPFFTTKPPGQGTGLGLAQVYGIVAEHGGVVDLVSTLDSGTAVQIFLPLSDSTDTRPLPVERSERAVVDRCRILLVEDQKVLSELVCRQLELLGHTVATASNGQEALSWLAQNETPEIVLCDVVMPLKGGREVLREIRERGLDTRVILMSGNPGQDDYDREIEPDGWLNKPFRANQLASMIETVLSLEAASH